MPMRSRRTTPNPRFRSKVELFCGDARSQLDLPRVDEALSCQSLSSKQPPPRLLQVKPARPYGYEDLLHPRVFPQPLSDGRLLWLERLSVISLPGVLGQFVRAYPDIDINLSESSTAEVENWVRQGVVDVGFAVLPISDLHTLHIAVDKRVCTLPEDYGEASSAEPLDVRHLAEEPFILPRGYHEEKIKEIFTRTGIDPPIRFRLRDIRTILAMVRSGLGWSIVNE
jgi:DNA-binding transcriptional LysR family regulator